MPAYMCIALIEIAHHRTRVTATVMGYQATPMVTEATETLQKSSAISTYTFSKIKTRCRPKWACCTIH